MSDKKILLVDDAAFMRMMIKDILVKNGFNVCGEGQDGVEAIAKYKELSPDLVIMDITMPNMDGLNALKTIKKDYPNAKIVMCSAMGQESYVVDALKNGVSDFIVKPFQADKLIAGTYAVLNKKMPEVPEEYINNWYKHFRYPDGNLALTQNEIDEIIDSYIIFAKNFNTGSSSRISYSIPSPI